MRSKRVAELEADLEMAREALMRIRDEAATMPNGGAWSAGLATLCLGSLDGRAKRRAESAGDLVTYQVDMGRALQPWRAAYRFSTCPQVRSGVRWDVTR